MRPQGWYASYTQACWVYEELYAYSYWLMKALIFIAWKLQQLIHRYSGNYRISHVIC